MFSVLYEDHDIIVVIKPVGVPTQSEKSSDFDLVNQLKNYLYEKQKNNTVPYLGIIHRLDRAVGGILVFAKNKKAAAKLSEQVRTHNIQKYYLAVVTTDLTSQLSMDWLFLEDKIVFNKKERISYIVSPDKNIKEAKTAQLYYRVRQVKEVGSLVEIHLKTGRNHQIRVQMAAHNGGIYGDSKYNPVFFEKTEKKDWYPLGLYACQLSFFHPVTNKWLEFCQMPEEEPFTFFECLKDFNFSLDK